MELDDLDEPVEYRSSFVPERRSQFGFD